MGNIWQCLASNASINILIYKPCCIQYRNEYFAVTFDGPTKFATNPQIKYAANTPSNMWQDVEQAFLKFIKQHFAVRMKTKCNIETCAYSRSSLSSIYVHMYMCIKLYGEACYDANCETESFWSLEEVGVRQLESMSVCMLAMFSKTGVRPGHRIDHNFDIVSHMQIVYAFVLTTKLGITQRKRKENVRMEVC